MKRVVVISDLQVPYHDAKALNNLISFIGDYQPDELYQIGDLNDYETPSRWNEGTRREYSQQVKSESDKTKRFVFDPIRAVYSGFFGVLEGNHDLRPRTYLSNRAPALAEFSEDFHFSRLLDFGGFGVSLIPPFHTVGPDTQLIHGHEIKGLSGIAGTTAFGHATKAVHNIVMGHTHRLGVRRQGPSHLGGLRWGFEVGHIMDPRKAQYLGPGAVANWQAGFGILYVGDRDVSPYPVDIRRDGSFVVEGECYGMLARGAGGRFARKGLARD
ncbi:metallophosphoesterase [Streptomyces sp. NPDC051662]|uniref:metallophosphoesterase n=1 Tax=Streptomyces sp. NPDC051662 TaxID=3154750 RepID=UPI003418CA7E